MAEVIFPDRAQRLAQQYINVSASSAAKSKSFAGTAESPYYIFTGEGGKGFVVVSGDDALGEVLAYSRTSTLDTTLHTGAEVMLNVYAQAYYDYKLTGNAPVLRSRTFSRTYGPLMTTLWNQGYPYNRLLPNGYRMTGCGPTAVSQVMYYHKWPARGHGSLTYTNVDGKEVSGDFNNTYDWAHMKNTYGANDDSVSVRAVAQLMRDVGIASNTLYYNGAAGTFEINFTAALNNNFDYDAVLFARNDEGNAHFYDMVVEEIMNGFPVILAGYSYGSNSQGHTFVADGLDEQGFVHLNYGWSGTDNGFYSMGNTGWGKNMNGILVHPKGKDGSAPLPDRRRADAPHLHFSTGGYIRVDGLKEDSVIARPAYITLKMAEFKNVGKPFSGDMGFALVNERGDTVLTTGSETYSQGGFTSKLSNGKFDTNGLIVENNDVIVKLPLADLEAGYYKGYPVVAAYDDSTQTYGRWFPVDVAPQFEIELTASALRICEEGGSVPGSYAERLQIAGQPSWSKDNIKAGNYVTARLPIDNLRGISTDGTLYATLYNYTTGDSLTTTNALATLDCFYSDNIDFYFYIPSDAPDGYYRVSLTYDNDRRTDPVADYRLNQPAYIAIGDNPGPEPTPTPMPDPEPTPDPDPEPTPDPEPVKTFTLTSAYATFTPEQTISVEAWKSQGVSAYIIEPGNDTLILRPVSTVGAGEGVLLIGAPDTELELTPDSVGEENDNLLVGVIESLVVDSIALNMQHFYLSVTDTAIVFLPVGNAGKELSAGEAYLSLPLTMAQSMGADDGLTLKFSNGAAGTLTAIPSVPAYTGSARTVVYDLSGRRLSNPVRGIYIINGRKVILK